MQNASRNVTRKRQEADTNQIGCTSCLGSKYFHPKKRQNSPFSVKSKMLSKLARRDLYRISKMKTRIDSLCKASVLSTIKVDSG